MAIELIISLRYVSVKKCKGNISNLLCNKPMWYKKPKFQIALIGFLLISNMHMCRCMYIYIYVYMHVYMYCMPFIFLGIKKVEI